MRIANNLSALTAFTSLNRTNKSLQKTINALSTGLRINSASDDAAGLAVSEKMRTQISGLDEALRNTQDGMSLLQTAEGALEQTSSMLQRMRELTVQASNGTLTSQDRQYIQLEVDEIRTQIDRIAGTTQFNRKRILDGSSGALWSSSDAGVRARINGGLTYTDDAGNRVSSEGNYRLEVKASPGEAQVQKSNIFLVKTEPAKIYEGHNYADEILIDIENPGTSPDESVWAYEKRWGDVIEEAVISIKKDGSYHIKGAGNETHNIIYVEDGVKADILLEDVNIVPSVFNPIAINTNSELELYLAGSNILTASYGNGIGMYSGAKLTISDSKEKGGSLYVRGGMASAGIGREYVDVKKEIEITIQSGNITARGGSASAGIGGAVEMPGGKITITGGNVTAIGGRGYNAGANHRREGGAGIGGGCDADGGTITIIGGNVTATGGEYAAGIGGGGQQSNVTVIGGGTDSGTIQIRRGLYNPSNTGSVKAYAGNPPGNAVPVGHGNNGNDNSVNTNAELEAPETETESDEHTNTLHDVKQLYTSEGAFIPSQPKTLTITQGDGQTATITLYDTDTMQDVADKINSVIADKFGHAKHTDNPAKFCTISDGTQGTSESVYDSETVCDSDGNITGYNLYATMLVRSGVPGKAGELYFSGDDDLLNALGLNTIRESSETTYTASVYDVHSGKAITSDFRASGQEFKSIIPPATDIELDAESGINSTWDESNKRYEFSGGTYTATLHLKDNGITFQTGANGGEDFTIQLGDMSSKALGLSSVNVATRETATRSMAIIDSAISRVSSQRAKIGAYQNALEHTSESLTVTTANLMESESRIRDADMAGYMMDFVRLQILNQSGTSMLSQANQLPQSVLSLLGN